MSTPGVIVVSGSDSEALARQSTKNASVIGIDSIADDVAEAPGQEHRRQRGDERLDLEVVDHQPDEQAEERADEQDRRG